MLNINYIFFSNTASLNYVTFSDCDCFISGVDLVSIKPIHNVITLQEDITTDRCRQVTVLKEIMSKLYLCFMGDTGDFKHRQRQCQGQCLIKNEVIFNQPNFQGSRSVQCINSSKTVFRLKMKWEHSIWNENMKN